MERKAMVIGIKPEHIPEYKRLHANAWPEILAQIADCNIRNYSIFLREPENLLFGYFEYHVTTDIPYQILSILISSNILCIHNETCVCVNNFYLLSSWIKDIAIPI